MPDEASIQLRTETLLARLPLGDASIWRAPVMVDLCRALATEAARNYDDAVYAALDGFMPDTADAFLPEWEALLQLDPTGLTIEQRRGQVIALLRGTGDPSVENLNAILKAIIPEGTVTHLVHQPPAVAFEVGTDLGTEQAVVTACCLPMVLGSTDMEDQSYLTLLDASVLGPVEGRYGESAIGYLVNAGGAIWATWTGDATEGHRASMWLRTDSPCTLTAQYDLEGWVSVQTFTLGTSWTNLIMEIPAGAAALGWRILAETEAAIALSWVLTGRHSEALERAATLALRAPRHSVLEFAVQKEYNT